MKILCMICLMMLFKGLTAEAWGPCSNQQEERGCHTELLDCDRPTHYTCQSCQCPNLSKNQEWIDLIGIDKLNQNPSHLTLNNCFTKE